MENLNSKNFEDSAKKKVALITHQGITYGTKQHIIFEKNLYYGSNSNSHLNKYNILHLDYNNYPCPERDIYWVCINKVKFSKAKISFLTLLACMKTFYLIRSWSTFLGWLICIQQYNKYIKYCEVIQKFKNLKIAIIDYDFLCPKALILALAKNNIKTVATQERFVYTFCTSFASVIVDTYYVASEFAANFIKKSKYYDVKNTIPVGQYRSDYISLYKDKNIPEEIFQSKKNGKKIIVALGFHTSALWFKASTSLYISWIAHKNFLEDIVRLSENLENTFIVLRYKHLDWADKPYFKNILNKINECENITISKNYKESFHSYKLCANADLVIAKHTSLADECLAKKTPVLFHEYTHNLKGIMAQVFDYRPSNLMCFSYEDLLKRSKSILFDQNSELKEEINFLYNKYYKIKNNNTVKETIHQYLEKHIEKSLLI